MFQSPVLVLGAGIQGVCTALALRCRGYPVTLIDQMPGMMLRTSLRNEGKIHLGFVYANDPGFRTSPLLLRAALHFGPLMQGWLDTPINWNALVSKPFLYLVMRDSMLSREALYAHYERLENSLNELVLAGERTAYLGRDLQGKRLWHPAPPSARKWFAPEDVTDVVETTEIAIDRQKLGALLGAQISACPEITTRFGHRVETIERTTAGFCVAGNRSDGTRWSESAETVVNCLWDGRLAVDRQTRHFA